jgi:hypothetical protein
MCRMSWKSGNRNLLVPSGPHRACYGPPILSTRTSNTNTLHCYISVSSVKSGRLQGDCCSVCSVFQLDCLSVCGATAPQWGRVFSFTKFLDHTLRRTIVDRNPLDEWSARRRDLYLTTHYTYNRQTFMPPVGFETKISAGEWPQTDALDRAATGTGDLTIRVIR